MFFIISKHLCFTLKPVNKNSIIVFTLLNSLINVRMV